MFSTCTSSTADEEEIQHRELIEQCHTSNIQFACSKEILSILFLCFQNDADDFAYFIYNGSQKKCKGLSRLNSFHKQS